MQGALLALQVRQRKAKLHAIVQMWLPREQVLVFISCENAVNLLELALISC
jgi:hypothetical protein